MSLTRGGTVMRLEHSFVMTWCVSGVESKRNASSTSVASLQYEDAYIVSRMRTYI